MRPLQSITLESLLGMLCPTSLAVLFLYHLNLYLLDFLFKLSDSQPLFIHFDIFLTVNRK